MQEMAGGRCDKSRIQICAEIFQPSRILLERSGAASPRWLFAIVASRLTRMGQRHPNVHKYSILNTVIKMKYFKAAGGHDDSNIK